MDENNHTHQMPNAESASVEAPDSEHKMLFRGAIGIAVVVFVLTLLWLFFGGMFSFTQLEKQERMSELQQMIDSVEVSSNERDIEGTLAATDEALQHARALGAPEFIISYLEGVRALSLFRTNTEENQREAVRLAKSAAGDERLLRETRANAVNTLLTFYYSARAPHIFDEIFDGESFASFAEDAGNQADAIRALAEYSVSLYPTSLGLLREVNWYAGELLDNTALPASTQQEYREEIEARIAQARALFAQEQQTSTSLEKAGARALFHHWVGYHLAVLTVHDAGDPKTFEEFFQTALAQRQSPDGGDSDALATTIVYTHFYYAAFLHEVYGDERIEDQRAQLQSLVDMVNAQPSIFEPGFLAFMERERTRPTETRDHNYEWFIELAEVSPTFREFLTEHGWDLS